MVRVIAHSLQGTDDGNTQIITITIMKNIVRFLLCVVAIATLASCTKSATEGGSANRLATPEFSANATENTITVSWTAVEGAAYYEIALNEKAPERTDKTVHRFENLEWNTTYTVKLQAIAANAEDSSLVATQEVVIAARVVPVYREWYPQNGSTAIAISDDGRWVVGAFDRQGMILDLNSDEITYVENFEFSDVADTGVAVGCTFESSQSGEAAMYIQGKAVKIDLSELTTSNMSSLQSVTPDGTFVVGWWWEFEENSYYGKVYDTVVPFVYDVLKDRVTVLEAGDAIYGVGAVSAYGVSPDRRIVGCEQGVVMQAVVWEDEYSQFYYPVFEYDGEYNPVRTFGDTQVRMTPNGNYIYSIVKNYPEGGQIGGEWSQPACYNLETKELTVFEGTCNQGSVTAMTDDGLVFLNDVPYYMGTTSYVVDLKSGNTTEQTPIIDWLMREYTINLYGYLQDGIITIGASADGRKLLGIVNTDMGWMTYVIDLDGTPVSPIE